MAVGRPHPQLLSKGEQRSKGHQLHELNVDYFTEMGSGSEAGSCSRLKDFVYHSNLGLRMIKKKRTTS